VILLFGLFQLLSGNTLLPLYNIYAYAWESGVRETFRSIKVQIAW